jgi:hypothetical protein
MRGNQSRGRVDHGGFVLECLAWTRQPVVDEVRTKGASQHLDLAARRYQQVDLAGSNSGREADPVDRNVAQLGHTWRLANGVLGDDEQFVAQLLECR